MAKTTNDFIEDAKELIASYDEEVPPHPSIVDGAVVDWRSPDDVLNAEVKMYRRGGYFGWHWEVTIPQKTEIDRVMYWRKWRNRGYSITKTWASFMVKRSFKKFERTVLTNKNLVEYKVPMTEQPNYGKYAI